jgi:hypothetical protein
MITVRLDHLSYAVPDLDAAVADFASRAGVDPVPGSRHAESGTANYRVALSDDAYVAIVGPDPAQPVRSPNMPYGIEALTKPTLAAWSLRTDDLSAIVEHARKHGYDPGAYVARAKSTAGGGTLEWRMTPAIPDENIVVIPFLMQWLSDASPVPDRSPDLGILGLRVESKDVAATRARLEALSVGSLGFDVHVASADAFALRATLTTPNGDLSIG